MVDKIKQIPKKYNLSASTNSAWQKSEYKEILNYKKRGFTKIKVDGKYMNIDDFPNLNKR